jgi:hypothetical protein
VHLEPRLGPNFSHRRAHAIHRRASRRRLRLRRLEEATKIDNLRVEANERRAKPAKTRRRAGGAPRRVRAGRTSARRGGLVVVPIIRVVPLVGGEVAAGRIGRGGIGDRRGVRRALVLDERARGQDGVVVEAEAKAVRGIIRDAGVLARDLGVARLAGEGAGTGGGGWTRRRREIRRLSGFSFRVNTRGHRARRVMGDEIFVDGRTGGWMARLSKREGSDAPLTGRGGGRGETEPEDGEAESAERRETVVRDGPVVVLLGRRHRHGRPPRVPTAGSSAPRGSFLPRRASETSRRLSRAAAARAGAWAWACSFLATSSRSGRGP